MTVVDDAVVIGGAPIGFMGLPERLYEEYGVRGVVNMCNEYRGPTRQYEKLGMKELWLPTVDHFEPTVEDLKTAVSFIESYKANEVIESMSTVVQDMDDPQRPSLPIY